MKSLEGVDPREPVDPPSGKEAVYITTDYAYARWYAARSQGSLYVVEPIGKFERSKEDPFPSWTCSSARVVRIVERRVLLTRKDRRAILRRWKAADAMADKRGK